MTRGESMDNTEAIKVLMDMREDEYSCIQAGSSNSMVKALSLAIQALKPLPTLAELDKTILNTCKKELNQRIGFMLTKDEARIFSTAILDLLKKGE